MAIRDRTATSAINYIEMKGAEPIQWAQYKSIITNVTTSQSVNSQFLHTIGNDVYIYAFGDRLGEITLSGVAMSERSECGGPSRGLFGLGGRKQDENIHGFTHINKWYNENRASVRAEPLMLTVGTGGLPTACFLMTIRSDDVNPETLLTRYSMTFATIPQDLNR